MYLEKYNLLLVKYRYQWRVFGKNQTEGGREKLFFPHNIITVFVNDWCDSSEFTWTNITKQKDKLKSTFYYLKLS